ncbi:MAG: c-type cytochrome [Pseudomonadota bacterium]
MISVSALVVALAAPALAADAAHGKQLFKACEACHSDKPGNKLGPSLAGVVGRKAATLEDFRYSPAMTRSNLTWDETNLRDYITDPQAKVKGNRMPFAGIKQPSDADDIVAYLETLK